MAKIRPRHATRAKFFLRLNRPRRTKKLKKILFEWRYNLQQLFLFGDFNSYYYPYTSESLSSHFFKTTSELPYTVKIFKKSFEFDLREFFSHRKYSIFDHFAKIRPIHATKAKFVL